jgi:hypothetical protein
MTKILLAMDALVSAKKVDHKKNRFVMSKNGDVSKRRQFDAAYSPCKHRVVELLQGLFDVRAIRTIK